MIRYIFLILIFFSPTAASAYIGPGMAGGVVIAIIGFFAAIFITILAIIYYPIKRFYKKQQNKKK